MKVDIKKNFWVLNPEFNTLNVFQELKKVYGNANSSIIMWAIYMVFHPDGIIYKGVKEKYRIKNIEESWLHNKVLPDWNSKLIKDVIDVFLQITVSEHKRSFMFMEKALKEFNYKISREKMTEEKIKLLEKYDKIIEMYAKAKKLFDESEKTRKVLKGGTSLSAVQDPTTLFTKKELDNLN